MMNKQEILRKIGNIIQELNEQHQYLSSTSKINILELELFTANADFLIDHIEILKKLNNTVNDQQVVNIQEEKSVFPHSTENEVKEEKANTESIEESNEDAGLPVFEFSFEEPTEMIFDFEKKLPVEEVFNRELTEEEQRLIQEKQQTLPNLSLDAVEEEAVGPEPYLIEKTTESLPKQKEEIKPIEVFSESTSIEQPKEPKKPEPILSLNDILSGKTESKSISSQLGNKPAAVDLKSTISLNDKMMFIKELFNGYNLAYSEAIEILNRFDSFEAADNFLMKNYAEKNQWAKKQEVVDRLYEILNRKFKK